MGRRDLEYVVIAVMLLSGLYVVISGLATDLLGWSLFAPHRYMGRVFAGLVLLHLALKRRQIAAYLRRGFGRRPDRKPST
jgi:membrane protein implicated in regulation of membrane protease activity